MSYRAGDSGPSPYMQQLIKDIKEGRTPGQQRRAFNDKVLMGGVQAGLMGMVGGGNALTSYWHDQDIRKRTAEQKDAANMKAASAAGGARMMTHDDPYDAQGPELDAAKNLPSYMKQMDSSVLAGNALADQKLNASAENVPMGGYTTPNGRATHQDDADRLARDIDTSNQMMQTGGMMNSLPRNPSKY